MTLEEHIAAAVSEERLKNKRRVTGITVRWLVPTGGDVSIPIKVETISEVDV